MTINDEDNGGWPDVSEFDLAEAEPWDRVVGEPSKQYAAFRLWRDMAPVSRSFTAIAEASQMSETWCRDAAKQWAWQERAEAWDDACHHIEDRERLEAIRSMHKVHRSAGRLAVAKAMQALQGFSPGEMSPSQAARLLALGAKLERDTLLVSVEELQGLDSFDDEQDDPWEIISRELTPDLDADV